MTSSSAREPIRDKRIGSDPGGAIVVGLGDTDRSADALALARLLAEPLGAPLVLVRNQTRESVVDGVRQIAAQENAQLIVIGASKPSGLGRLHPRSVGERLLSEVRIPVVIAPRGYAAAEHSLGLIASAFDGSPESHQALEWAARLTRSVAGRLRVISVRTPLPITGLGIAAQSVEPGLRQELRREQAAAVAAVGGPVEALVRDGSPAGVLVETSRKADLLVMGSRGHGALPTALLGSVAHHVVRRAACPVTIHPPKRPMPAAEPSAVSVDDSRIDEMSATSFPASDPPPAWTWEVKAATHREAAG